MGEILIRLDGEPRGWARTRHHGKRHFNDPMYDAYKRELAYRATEAMRGRALLTGYVKLRVYAEFAIPKSWAKWKQTTAMAGALFHGSVPDLDNVVKCKDALNGIVWRDDAQVAHITAWKKYGPEPHVSFIVSELPDASEREAA